MPSFSIRLLRHIIWSLNTSWHRSKNTPYTCALLPLAIHLKSLTGRKAVEQPLDDPDEGTSQALQKRSAKMPVSTRQSSKKKATYPNATDAQDQTLNPTSAHASSRPPEHVLLPYHGNEHGPNMSRWHDIKDAVHMQYHVAITLPSLHRSAEQLPPKCITLFSRVIELHDAWLFAFSKKAEDINLLSSETYENNWPTRSPNRVALRASKKVRASRTNSLCGD